MAAPYGAAPEEAAAAAVLRAVRKHALGSVAAVSASASHVALTFALAGPCGGGGGSEECTVVAGARDGGSGGARSALEALVADVADGRAVARRDGAPASFASRHGASAAVVVREASGGGAGCVVVAADGALAVWERAAGAPWRLAGDAALGDGSIAAAAWDGGRLGWATPDGVFAAALALRDGRLALGLVARLADAGPPPVLRSARRGLWRVDGDGGGGARYHSRRRRGGGPARRWRGAAAASCVAPGGHLIAVAANGDVARVDGRGRAAAAARAARAPEEGAEGAAPVGVVARGNGDVAILWASPAGGVLAFYRGTHLEPSAEARLPPPTRAAPSVWSSGGRVGVAYAGGSLAWSAAWPEPPPPPPPPAAPPPRPYVAARRPARRGRAAPAGRVADALALADALGEAPRRGGPPLSVARAAALARGLGLDPTPQAFGDDYAACLFLCLRRRGDPCFGCFELLCHAYLALRPEALQAFVARISAAGDRSAAPHLDSASDSNASSSSDGSASDVSSDGGDSLPDADEPTLLLWDVGPAWPPQRETAAPPATARAAAAPLPRRRPRFADYRYDRRALACLAATRPLAPAQRAAIAAVAAFADDRRKRSRA